MISISALKMAKSIFFDMRQSVAVWKTHQAQLIAWRTVKIAPGLIMAKS
jgi:hypothetical protein